MNSNPFFELALKKAASLLGKKPRMIMLISRLALKLRNVDWRQMNRTDIKEKMMVLARLFKAYAVGQYRSIPWKPLLLVTAAIIYFVSPLDFIPDLIPGLGFTDDFGILLMVYNSVHSELEKFLTWEKSQVTKQ